MAVDEDELRAFTVAEVAERIGLSVVQLRRVIDRGEMRVRRVGRRVLIPASALREFLEAR
jgi:excisionase family DNA binding protein